MKWRDYAIMKKRNDGAVECVVFSAEFGFRSLAFDHEAEAKKWAIQMNEKYRLERICATHPKI